MTFMLNPKSRYFEWKNYAHMLLYNNFGICIDLQGIEMLNYLQRNKTGISFEKKKTEHGLAL